MYLEESLMARAQLCLLANHYCFNFWCLLLIDGILGTRILGVLSLLLVYLYLKVLKVFFQGWYELRL
jgi:hypothetical protein